MKDLAPPRDRAGAEEAAAWTELYRELVRRCRAAGVMDRTPVVDAVRAAVVMGLYGAMLAALLAAPAWPLRLLLLAIAAFAGVQAGMIGHDAGHGAFAWSPGRAGWPGQLFLTIGAGWPFAHWIDAHHSHHRHTNDVLRDPDMQDGLFALSRGQATRRRGLLRAFTRHQHLVLWPLGTLLAFGIRARAIAFICRGGRRMRVDRAVMAAHLVLWLVVPALVLGPVAALVNYLLWTWLMGPYLMGSFFWNHVGTRAVTAGEKLPFFQQRLLGTRSLGGHWTLSVLFGGLNHHVEHHLVPNAPIARLGRARAILVALCAERGLPYRVHGFVESIAGVHAHVRAVGAAVSRTDRRCPRTDARPAAPGSAG